MLQSTEVLQDLVNTRSSWFPAQWVGGEGESVRSDVEKKSMNSGESSFSVEMLKSPRTTSGVPSSGQQLRRASISSQESRRGPGGRLITTMWSLKGSVIWAGGPEEGPGRTTVGKTRSPVPPPPVCLEQMRGQLEWQCFLIQVSVRARKWRVCREAQAEMVSAFFTADWQFMAHQYFRSSTGGECWIAEIGWVTASISVSPVKSSGIV